MKMSRRLIGLCTIGVLVLGTSVTAFASSQYSNVSDNALGANKSITEENRRCYLRNQKEGEDLEDLKDRNFEFKKDKINELVSNGTITQEVADSIIKELEEASVNCDGTGKQGIAKEIADKYGVNLGFGRGEAGQRGFKNKSLDSKKERINELVSNGTITQEKADEMIKQFEEFSANCNGKGQCGRGQGRRLNQNQNNEINK